MSVSFLQQRTETVKMLKAAEGVKAQKVRGGRESSCPTDTGIWKISRVSYEIPVNFSLQDFHKMSNFVVDMQ